MKISFDLDGVIADSDRWFFRLLSLDGDPQILKIMELDYYASRPLKHHPNNFLSSKDEGYIITARKPHAKSITDKWLKKYGIYLPIIYVDGHDDIDWADYQKGSIIAGKRKAGELEFLGIQIHFDNNPYIVEILRQCGIKSILIGGGLEGE
jgi:FMN phosphatase YigB (HAD superfamily)